MRMKIGRSPTAAGFAAVLVTSLLSVCGKAPEAPEPMDVPRASAGGIASAQSETRAAVESAQASPGAENRDPFAGVDPNVDPTLRLIARIDERRPAKATGRVPDIAPPPAKPAEATRPTAPAIRSEAALDGATASQSAVARPPEAQPTPTATALSASPSPAAQAAAEPEAASLAPAAAPTPNLAPSPTPAPPQLVAARAEPPARASVPNVTPPLRPRERPAPRFPVEALRAGVDGGRVTAQLTVGADGRVTDVQVVSSSPPGVFERESRRALFAWRYEPPGRIVTTRVELVFRTE
jgi:protein TonB